MPFDMGELIVDEGATVGDTSISPRVIRDLLNRPRGLQTHLAQHLESLP